jgi:hypothetical protein
MFDSAPPNLPVEPTSGAPVAPQPAPSAAPVPIVPPPAPSGRGKKEPEDIFSGLEQSSGSAASDAMPMIDEVPHRGSPLKVVAIVVAALVVVDQTQTPVTQPPTGANIPAPQPIEPTPNPGTPTAAAALSEGVDGDADGLTNTEESFYNADLANADTDGDSYSDGSEAMNLFSPASPGKKLEAETFMQKLTWAEWSFILPKPWTVMSDPQNPSIGWVTTSAATHFSLDLKSNTARETLIQWVGGTAIASGMRSFTTKMGLEALQTQDGRTTYLAAGDSVMVVTYDLNGDTVYDYRTTYAMVVNALAPSVKK